MSRTPRRSRRASRAGAQPAAQEAVADPPVVDDSDPYEAFSGREWPFAFLASDEPEVVDEPALHALMKQWRHGRATRTLGQAFSDAYFAVFTVVLLGAMLTNAVVGSQAAALACDTVACAASRSLVPWGVLLALGAFALGAARLVGPVAATAAEGGWLMAAPISRARLLRGRLLAVVVVAGLVGTVANAAVAALAGASWPLVAAWAAAGGLTTAGLVAWAATEQSRSRTGPLAVLRRALGLAAVAVLAWLVVAAAAGTGVPLPGEATGPALAAVVALGTVTLVVNAVVAVRRLEKVPRARLVSGGALVSGMQGAMFALDLGLARDILVEREAAERGHVRAVRGRGTGAWALVWRDAHRLRRFPQPLAGVVAAVCVPYVAGALGLGPVMPLLAGLALVAALVPTLGALRVLSRTRGLARSLPLSTRQVRLATTAVPTVLALLWAALAAPAFTGLLGGVSRAPAVAAASALAVGLGGLLGAIRWQTAKPVDFAVPMVATETGAVPPTLVFNLLRGFDMVALVTAPILLGFDPLWALAVAVVAHVAVTAGLDPAELSARAEEQRRELEREKTVAKTRRPRPKGPNRAR